MMTSGDLNQLLSNKLTRFFIVYSILSVMLAMLIAGISWFHGGSKLTHIELPLISDSKLSVDGDFIVTRVPMWNRVQIYHRERGFISGFFLEYQRTTGAFKVFPNQRLVDCGSNWPTDTGYLHYTFNGKPLGRTQSADVADACSGHHRPTSASKLEHLGVFFQFDGFGYSLQAASETGLKMLNHRNFFADLLALSLYPFALMKVFAFLLGAQVIWFFYKAMRLKPRKEHP
ncbi:hypothetical protein [Pseudovibrio denitrificans]|nr:hypothetical protein [Pseudovibrio denitrificans]